MFQFDVRQISVVKFLGSVEKTAIFGKIAIFEIFYAKYGLRYLYKA